ncbi:unnamed protein product [Lactuca saligna]|uniref:Uncharacterized protein n=1 Tax=Lactuca saligna TaxID=75948 RepID=A0AA35Y7Y6_LACSI|nr:unnamed protein product [Lactuca saligna]
MLKRVYPSNPILVSYLATINTSVDTRILLPQISEKKSKKSKTADVGSSDTKVKSSKKTKQVPVIEPEPIQPEPIIPDTQVTKKEVILLKTGVFRRIKMKSKSKRRSSVTNFVRKTKVSHQGVIFWEILAPASPSSKKRIAADMAKHISKKKQRNLVISSDSTADEIEVIPETPETVLIKESSKADTSVTQPPKVSSAKIVTVEARTSDIPINISDMDTIFIMDEDTLNNAAKGNTSNVVCESLISLPSQTTPIIPTTSTTDSPTFTHIISHPFTTLFSSQSTDPPTTTSPLKDSFLETEMN